MIRAHVDGRVCGWGGGVLGRIDQMVTVRGINVYPSALDNIIRGHAAVDEYEVHIRADRAMDELVLKVEVAGGKPVRFGTAPHVGSKTI